jgi:hypothetical protein
MFSHCQANSATWRSRLVHSIGPVAAPRYPIYLGGPMLPDGPPRVGEGQIYMPAQFDHQLAEASGGNGLRRDGRGMPAELLYGRLAASALLDRVGYGQTYRQARLPRILP